MAEEKMELKYFRFAQELNKEYAEMLKTKNLHFRGNRGSFSLISLDRETPEQGKSGFIDKEQGRRFLLKNIDSLLTCKKEKISAEQSRPTREKELQAWIINYAINNKHQLPFSCGLTFLTSELAFIEPGKIVNDILAIDQNGCLVVIELKSTRNKQTLEEQVNKFRTVIFDNQDFFKSLVTLLAGKEWNGQVRGMIVWPDANGQPRNDWKEGIEEVRYLEKLDDAKIKQIDYNNEGEIVFL